MRYFIIPLSLILFYFLFRKKISLEKFPLYTQRGVDEWGDGSFNAPRTNSKNEKYLHKGIDLKFEPNTPFKIPFPSKLIRKGTVYPNDTFFKLLEFQGTGIYKKYTYKVMYIVTNDKIGTIYKTKQNVGSVQDLRVKYFGITPHVHFEIYENGVLINPNNVLKIKIHEYSEVINS